MRDARLPAAALGGAALLALVLLALGGAADRPGGLWLGLPSVGSSLAAVAGVVALAAVARARGVLAASTGWAVAAVLLLAGVPLAGVRAVSGPVLLALAGACAASLAVALGLRAPRLLLLPLAFALFAWTGARSSVRVGPQGDEPHYLMVADSLLRDHDVSLERDYAEQRYAAFHDAPLAPHYRVRGRGREIYSLHAVGLSLAILPAWALGGYPAVTVFMALLAALLVVELRSLVADVSGREDVAEAAAWALALSPPLLHYAGLVFTEVPAALAFTFALRRGRRPLGLGGALAVGAAAAVLPWLNVRYAPLALVAVGHAVWRQPAARRVAAIAAPLVVSAAGIALYHHELYGFWNPGRVYGSRPEFSAATLLEGLPGLLLDQEFGLLVYAPVLVLALPGLALLLHRDRRLGVAALAAVGAVVLTAGSWHMWRGGFNPPGRFLVPVAPLLFACAALVWQRRGLTAGTALLVGWGLWAGLGGALEPQLVHRDRDGSAPFFRVLSGAREWSGLLPRYVLEEPDRWRLAGVWAVALLAAVPWRRGRPQTARRTAAAALGLVAAAQVASLAGRRDAAERDAARLVGRPAIAVPGWRATPAATAEWSASDLGWGPLYEPHRHPGGVELARRLAIVPGPYALSITAESLTSGAQPIVEFSADHPGAVWHPAVVDLVPGGFRARLDAPAGGVLIRLRGGGPMLVRRIVLASQPSAGGPV